MKLCDGTSQSMYKHQEGQRRRFGREVGSSWMFAMENTQRGVIKSACGVGPYFGMLPKQWGIDFLLCI